MIPSAPDRVIGPRWLLATLLVAAVCAWLTWRSPLLTEVHWDSPIYLYQGKRYAETDLLDSYRRHAEGIAAQVDGRWPAEEKYAESYWRFTRLGHIALVGTMVSLLGSGESAILAIRVLMSLLMVATFVLGLALTLALTRLLPAAGRPAVTGPGLIAASACFVLSDITSYLARSVVSEVPAMVAVTLAALAMTSALLTRSTALAAVAGLCAFLAYVFRMESVWPCITFFGLVVVFAWRRDPSSTLRLGVTATLGAALPFACYAWFFMPLADPRLFLAFADSQPGNNTGVPPLLSLTASGGLLWLGTLMSLGRCGRCRPSRLLAMWIGACLLPTLPYLLRDAAVQARMFSTLLPALSALSLLGWSDLFERMRRHRALALPGAALALLLVAVSVEPIYTWLHGAGGLWRVQTLRRVLATPRYERLSYDVGALRQIAQSIDSSRVDVVVHEPGEVRQEDLNIVRFFGAAYASSSDLALTPDPTNGVGCAQRKMVFTMERPLYCVLRSVADVAALRARHVLLLRKPAGTDHGLERWGIRARDTLVSARGVELVRLLVEP